MTKKQLPEIIYIRRRVAAIVILLVVVALAIWLMVSLGGGKEEKQPQPTPSASAFDQTSTPTSGPEVSASGTPAIDETEDAIETETPTATETPTKEAKSTCALEDLVVSASSDKPTYEPGERPKFYLTIKNPTAVDCKIDLRKDGLRFEVYDLQTNQRLWTDTDCNRSEDTSERTFPAGEERHYEAIWSRTASAPDKCGERTEVPAGSYFLHTLVGDNNSDAYPFNLS